jgi:uncharacterized protein YndB with AHSA1/START domain
LLFGQRLSNARAKENETMWSIEETAAARVPPERVYNLWKDVSGWNRWDDAIEWSRLEGDFQVGSRGKFKQKSGPAIAFEIIQVEPGRGFTLKVKLPLATMMLIHRAETVAEGTRVLHRVELHGVLSGLFAALLGKKLRHGLPHATRGIAGLAEKQAA